MSVAQLWRRLVFFVRRDRITAELEDEMRLHVALRAERRENAGEARPVAAAAAARGFGNAGRLVEQSRDEWGVRWADDLARDVRFGARALRRSPALTIIIVVTLGLGIGATTSMVSIVDASLVRPLPLAEPERLVILPRLEVPLQGVPSPRPGFDLPLVRRQSHVFQDVGAYGVGGLNLTGGDEPMRVHVGLVTPSALSMLGVSPEMGRLFTDDEGLVDGPDVTILSYDVWSRRFGADRTILGKNVGLNGRPYRVVGVMPRRFAFPEGSEVWIPMTVPMSMARTEIFAMFVMTSGIGRLRDGVSLGAANRQLIEAMKTTGWRSRAGEPPPELVRPVRNHFAGDVRSRLWVVFGLASLVLVAACANACGLLLARSAARRRELALRTALGATRPRIVRQLGTESALLALGGALLGLGIAVWATKLFAALAPPALIALTPPSIDGRVLAATVLLSLGMTFAVGLLPALIGSRADLATMLNGGRAEGSRGGSRWLGGALVGVEVALAAVLLVGSGLMIKSLARLLAVETGVRSEGVVTARIALSNAQFPDRADRLRFHETVMRELERVPGVQNAAVVSALPLRGEWNPRLAFDIVGRDLKRSPFAEHTLVSANYFASLGIALRAGRTFVASDTAQATAGAVINESLARAYWPGKSPLGERISMGDARYTIVGVVNDVRSTALDEKRYDQVYLPIGSATPAQATLVVRGTLSDDRLLAELRNAVSRVDRMQVIYDLKPMRRVALESVTEQRTAGRLITVFGGVTAFLAALGLYGLLAFAVERRVPEIGIRLAIGAQRSNIVRLIVGQGLAVAVVGTAAGLGLALAAARVMRSLLFEVSTTDAQIYLLVALLLVATAVLAAARPAIMAARVDPLRALRAE